MSSKLHNQSPPVSGYRAGSAERRAARAAGWLALSFFVIVFMQGAEDVLGLGGSIWAVLRAAAAVAFVAALILWAHLALRAAGGARTWFAPVAIAGVLTVALASLGWMLIAP